MHALFAFLTAAATFAPPALVVLAYLGWVKGLRGNLPRWRSFMGVMSIALTLLNWLIFLALSFALLMHLQANFFTDGWFATSALIAGVSTFLAFALKGTPRTQAVVAGLFMTSIWIISLANE
jgi:hypothetical protein